MTDSRPTWLETVIRLCRNGFNPDGPTTGGAQVQIFNRDTEEMVYRQPIGREVRFEKGDGEPILWFRQIIGTGPLFSPADCRRRSLFTTDATVSGDRVTFPQPQAETHEYGIILPADPDQITVLDAWDTWKLTQISAQAEADLDALTEDSWW